jgi:RHS repeat-associated protein
MRKAHVRASDHARLNEERWRKEWGMYDPRLGRFLSRDPLPENGLELFHPFPDMTPYLYVRNNPITRLDPSGLLAVRVIIGGPSRFGPLLPVLYPLLCAKIALDGAREGDWIKPTPRDPSGDHQRHCYGCCIFTNCMGKAFPYITLLGGLTWECLPGTFEWGDLIWDLRGTIASIESRSCRDACEANPEPVTPPRPPVPPGAPLPITHPAGWPDWIKTIFGW